MSIFDVTILDLLRGAVFMLYKGWFILFPYFFASGYIIRQGGMGSTAKGWIVFLLSTVFVAASSYRAARATRDSFPELSAWAVFFECIALSLYILKVAVR